MQDGALSVKKLSNVKVCNCICESLRRDTILILQCPVRPRGKKKTDEVFATMRVEDSVRQRSVAVNVLGVHIRPMFDEQSCDFETIFPSPAA
jgi:hypothetical protein